MENEIRLKIVIDGKEAIASVQLTDAELRKLAGSVRNASNESRNLGEATVHSFAQARNLIQGLQETIGVLSSIFSSSLSAYQEQEVALTKLNTALNQTNQFTDANLKTLIDYSAQLQKTTVYGDEATQSVMAQLLAMGLTVEQTKQATLQAANLASVMGTDLNTAARAMADLFQGNVGMIGRYVKGLDETIIKSGDLNAIIDMLNERIGGQAEAIGETSVGAIAKMNNAIGDLKENLGGLISTALAPLINHISNLFSSINQLSPSISGLIGLTIALTSTYMLLASTGIGATIKQLLLSKSAMEVGILTTIKNTIANAGLTATNLTLAGSFRIAGLAAKGFFASLGPIGWLAVGLGVVIEALNLFSSSADDAADSQNQFNAAIKAMDLQSLRNELKKVEDVSSATRTRLYQLQQEYQSLANSQNTSLSQLKNKLSEIEDYQTSLNKLNEYRLELTKQIEQKENEIKSSLEAQYKQLREALDVELKKGDINKQIEQEKQGHQKRIAIIKENAQINKLSDEQLKKDLEDAEKVHNDKIAEIKSKGYQRANELAFNKAKESLSEKQRHEQAMLKLQTDNDLLLLQKKIEHFNEMINLYKKYGMDVTELANQLSETELELNLKLKPEIKIEDTLPFEAEELAEVQYGNVLEYARLSKMEELELWRKTELEKAATYENSAEVISAIEKEYARRRNEIRQMETNAALDVYSQMFANLSALFGQHTAAYKAMAIAQTIIETYKAATAALSPPPVGAGPLLGPILAITTLAAGFANVQKIAATKIPGFQAGGRLKKGEVGFIEGYGNEIIAPEKTFVEVFRQELRPQIYSNLNYDNSKLLNELRELRNELKNGGIMAIAYLDDREAKRIVNTGTLLKRKSVL